MTQDSSSGKTQPEACVPRRAAPFCWALLAVVLAAGLWHLHLITAIYLPANHSDLLPTWSATRVALAGKDPYSGDAVIQMQKPWYTGAPNTIIHPEPQNFWYPGQTIVLFAPFAGISWPTERLLYLTVVPILLVLTFWPLTRFLSIGLSMRWRLLVSLTGLSSWPVLWGLRLQQLSLVLAVIIFFAWYLLARGKQIAPGILLALATIKPQLVVPLILWILIWAVAGSRWRLLGAFAGALATLLVIAERIMPGWILHWLSAIQQYRAATHSSPQLESAFGHWPGLILDIAILAVAALGFLRLRKCSPGASEFSIATALALAVAVLMSPFNPPIIYNYVFLFPAILLVVFRRPENRLTSLARMLIIVQAAFNFFAPVISVIGESIEGHSNLWTVLPFLDFLLPLLATAGLLLEIWTLMAPVPIQRAKP